MVYVLISALLPATICSITAIVDATISAETHYHQDLLSYPEMGIYTCFLGSARTHGNLLFLKRPEFIYFGFWIILIMLGLFFDLYSSRLICFIRNGVLMCWTSFTFCSHGLNHGGSSHGEDGILQKLSKQFVIVIRLQG